MSRISALFSLASLHLKDLRLVGALSSIETGVRASSLLKSCYTIAPFYPKRALASASIIMSNTYGSHPGLTDAAAQLIKDFSGHAANTDPEYTRHILDNLRLYTNDKFDGVATVSYSPKDCENFSP